MNRLMKAEFFKLSKLVGYKVLLFGCSGLGLAEGLFVILYCVSAGEKPPMGYGYFVLKLHLVWPLFAALITGVYAAIFLCSEFGNRTYGMNLLCGLPRFKVFLSKMTVFYAGLLPVFYLQAIAASVIVSIGYGFGKLTAGDIAEFLWMFFCSVLAYLALGGYYALLAVWTKNPVATLGLGFMGAYMQIYWRNTLRGVGWAKEEPFLLKLCFMYQIDRFWAEDVLLDGFYLFVILTTFLVTFSGALFFYVKSDLK